MKNIGNHTRVVNYLLHMEDTAFEKFIESIKFERLKMSYYKRNILEELQRKPKLFEKLEGSSKQR